MEKLYRSDVLVLQNLGLDGAYIAHDDRFECEHIEPFKISNHEHN